MKMKNLCWLFAAVLSASTTSLAIAQEAKGKQNPASVIQMDPVRIVNLSFISAYQLVDSMRELGLPIKAIAVGEHQIMLRGRAELVEHILATIVSVLDVADTDRMKVTTAVLSAPIGPTSSKNLLNMFSVSTTRGGQTQIAYDEGSQTLLVRAPQGEIDEIKGVLDQLAKPSRPILLECFFIRATLEGPNGKTDSKLPKILSSVGTALEASGLTSLELLSPMMVHSQEGEHFETGATFGDRHQETVESRGQMDFRVTGSAKLSEDGGTAEIAIEANVQGLYHNQREKDGQTGFQVSTSVATPVGDYAILAAAPSSTASGDVIALAIRVTSK